MRGNKLVLYVHLVWATWDRLPLITPSIERSLYRMIESVARATGCGVVALGGVEDHVHLLVSMPATVAVAEVVKAAKGSSSRLIGEALPADGFFKWQGSYGAFTVSRWDVTAITEYIKRQREHHVAGTGIAEYEATMDDADPPADA